MLLASDSKWGALVALAAYPQVTALSKQLLYFLYHGGYWDRIKLYQGAYVLNIASRIVVLCQSKAVEMLLKLW